jgi:hypothetical protein
MKNRDYQNAACCAAEIHQLEELEGMRSAAKIKADYRENLRLVRIKQREEVVALDAKLKYEREFFVLRRKRDRQVLINVRGKLDSRAHNFREPSKAWGITRVARMNSISKTIPPGEPLCPRIPPSPDRAQVRSSGKYERQVEKIQLPALDLKKL